MNDALDRACADMFASHHLDWNRMAPEGKQWWRGFVVEALRVMADDIQGAASWEVPPSDDRGYIHGWHDAFNIVLERVSHYVETNNE